MKREITILVIFYMAVLVSFLVIDRIYPTQFHYTNKVEKLDECKVTEWDMFRDKLLSVAHKLNNKYNITHNDKTLYVWLCQIIQRESNYDHEAQNKNGACGLIQWLPQYYDVPNNQFEQIDMIYDYFDYWIGIKGEAPKTKRDMYLLVLYPKAYNTEWIVFKAPSKAYIQNKNIDINNDKIVSAYELDVFLKNK